MRECLVSEVHRNLQSKKTNVVVNHSSFATQEELGVNFQLCPDRFSLKFNCLCVVLQIVISWNISK